MISTLSQFGVFCSDQKKVLLPVQTKTLVSLIPRQIMVSCEEGMSVGLESGTAG